MAVDGTMTPLVMRIIGVLDDDIVAEEARSLAGCVRAQRFLLGEFQLERVTQEYPELLLDRLGFGLWPGKSEEAVIGIAHIMQPPIRRIVGVPCGQPLRLFEQRLHVLVPSPVS